METIQKSTNQDYTQDNYIRIEPLIKEHFERNFFESKHSKNKIEDCYFNEAYVKSISEIYVYDYSVCSLTILFKVFKLLEIQNLNLKELDEVKNDGFLSEKAYNILNKNNNNKVFSTEPTNIIECFLQADGHLQKTMKDLYDNNNQVNNFEIENKICLSLFIIKKIIKDYSFYFNKAELESIFMQFKKFKEY